MPFIGNKPSAVPLTSADIADGIITSAKIVDATIANADIANSTINLTTKVTGTLPVANGGTGLTALGTSLQVLRTNTGATALEFATVSVAGTIVSINEAIDTTQRSTSSGSFVDLSSDLTITVTPASASNKFLILTDLWARGDGNETYTTIFRGATNLGDSSRGLTANPINTDYTRSPLLYLDSPNTTSSTTYKLSFKCEETTFRLNYDANSRPRKSRMIILEIKG